MGKSKINIKKRKGGGKISKPVSKKKRIRTRERREKTQRGKGRRKEKERGKTQKKKEGSYNKKNRKGLIIKKRIGRG